jgi:DNA polymerase-3 subunit gamma/tau
LLDALADGDGERLLATVAVLAEFSPDWGAVLDALADALHRVQVAQLVPNAAVESDRVDVAGLAARLRPELVQLWYQMALQGRRELQFAPSPRAGFEMSVLRMLAFRPAGAGGGQPIPPAGGTRAAPDARPAPAAAAPPKQAMPAAPPVTPAPAPAAAPPVAPAPMPAPTPASAPSPSAAVPAPAPVPTGALDAERWFALVEASTLRGPARVLASHAGVLGFDDGVLRLSLSAADDHLKSPSLVKVRAETLAPALGGTPQVRFEAGQGGTETLHQRSARERDARQEAAEAAFMADPGVQRLIQQHGAKVVPDSIRPFDE